MIKKYLLTQANKSTAWIGFLGLLFLILHLYSFLFLLFMMLIVFPESRFSDTFKDWTQKIKKQIDE